MKSTGLYDLVKNKPKSLSSDDIIRTLKNKFRSLKAQGLWIISEIKKLDMEGDIYGIKMAMNNLVESQKRGRRVEIDNLNMAKRGT